MNETFLDEFLNDSQWLWIIHAAAWNIDVLDINAKSSIYVVELSINGIVYVPRRWWRGSAMTARAPFKPHFFREINDIFYSRSFC